MLMLSRRMLVMGFFWLAGCTVGPDFKKPEPEQPQPRQWADLPALRAESGGGVAVSEQEAPEEWWRQFGDSLFCDLIERALRQNLSLREAAAVLAQSQAQQSVAAADQFPMLNGSASYTRMQASRQGILNLTKSLAGGASSSQAANGAGLGANANGTGVGAIGVPATGIQPFSLYQFGFDASWEADFWGRVRREQEAAAAGAEAAEARRRAARLSVIGDVAKNYLELRRLQKALALTERRLALAEERAGLLRLKARHGTVNELELETAQAAAAALQAGLPPLRQQSAQAVNSLNLVCGGEPGALNAELSRPGVEWRLPERLDLGLPSQLAQRRPDIQAAEAQLHQAVANIGLAAADFYPRFTLSGSTGLQALRLQNLGDWSALQYAMGPAITLPIFQGGRLTGMWEFRQAEQQQAAIQYQNTVLAAWQEIDNDLSGLRQAHSQRQSLIHALQADQRLTALARQRQAQGVSDYLPVLQAEQDELQAELQVNDSASLVAAQLTALYKALGGGWKAVESNDAIIR